MNSRMAASVPTSCAIPLLADSGSMVTVCSGVGVQDLADVALLDAELAGLLGAPG